MIRRALSLSFSDRDPHKESTSSMKIMLGLCARASSKRFRTSFSDSPSHFETKSELDTEKKVELFASVATAFARYDLPVPGGYMEKEFVKWLDDVRSNIPLLQTEEFLSKRHVSP